MLNWENTHMKNEEIIEMFGLTYHQTKLLFSAQKQVTEYDISITKNLEKAIVKRTWLEEWKKSIITYLDAVNENDKSELIESEEDLRKAFLEEINKSANKTWYYIVVLELIEYVPYTSLGTQNDKAYSKLRFDVDKNYYYIRNFIVSHEYLSEDKIDRLDKTYTKSLSKISGKVGKIITKVAIVIAITAVAAALAAAFAGPIAVALFGSEFAGLSGAALTSACLAMAGGGAIAAGGLGIQGGILVIAGGGALLGFASGGTAVCVTSALLLSVPEYTLTQAAKLETILKEVILNAQKDVVTAQKIIAQYQEQIVELTKELTKMELQNEKNKKEIQNIRTCLKYLKKSYEDMSKFTSAFDIGLQTEQ